VRWVCVRVGDGISGIGGDEDMGINCVFFQGRFLLRC
jgi:hypothetical protein